MSRPMEIEIADILAQLRTGEMEMIYARLDEATGSIFCTIRHRRPVLVGLDLKPLWNSEGHSHE